MPKLNPEHQIRINQLGLQKILQTYNLNLRNYKLAKGGIENSTFLLQTNKGKYALRVYRTNKKETKDIIQEIEFMALLRRNKLPVPRVFPNNQGLYFTEYQHNNAVWFCILMQLMEGSPLKKYTDQLIIEMANTQARMHKLGRVFAKTQSYRKGYIKILEDRFFVPEINLNKIKSKNVKDFLKRTKDFSFSWDQSLPKGFNHLDYDHGNVLVKNNRLSGVLDFDDLKYSPMVICLSYTMWSVLYKSKDKNKMFKYLSVYSKSKRLNKLETKAIKDILLFRNYAIGAMEVLFWGENGNKIKTFLELEKVLSALKYSDFNQASS